MFNNLLSDDFNVNVEALEKGASPFAKTLILFQPSTNHNYFVNSTISLIEIESGTK